MTSTCTEHGRSSWCTGTFAPPERGWSARAVFLRGQGTGHVRAVHGLDGLPPGISSVVVESRLPGAGQVSSGSYEGTATSSSGTATPQVVADAMRRLVTRRAGRARLITMNVLMISPGYPAEMAFFYPGSRGRRSLRHRGGRPAAPGRSGHRPGCARALHSCWLPGCRGCCRGDRARAARQVPPSTGWSACGSPT